jgi:hypothetical protein
MIVSFSKTGGIEWKTRIPKNQYSPTNDYFMVSFSTVHLNDKTYVLFNDSESNTKKNRFAKNADINSHTAISSQVQVLYCYDLEGNRSSKVFKSKDGNYFINPKSIKPLNDKHLILLGIRNAKQKFGRLVFGEDDKDE